MIIDVNLEFRMKITKIDTNDKQVDNENNDNYDCGALMER